MCRRYVTPNIVEMETDANMLRANYVTTVGLKCHITLYISQSLVTDSHMILLLAHLCREYNM